MLFACILKYVPAARVDWRDVRVGAAVTALLFTLGKWALGIYLGKSSPGSAYGAAGSLVVLVVWVYYSAQIFYFGAEFTHVHALANRKQLRPLRRRREERQGIGNRHRGRADGFRLHLNPMGTSQSLTAEQSLR